MAPRLESGSVMLSRLEAVSILRFLVKGTPFVIGQVSGKETIASVRSTYAVHPEFREREVNAESEPTGETRVAIYHVMRPTTFKKAFSLLSPHLERFTFTQHQIAEFLHTHMELLRCTRASALFLCTIRGKISIVQCAFMGECAYVSTIPLEHPYEMPSDVLYYIVVPEYATASSHFITRM